MSKPPKVDLDPHPPSYRTPIPRAPRLPHDAEQLLRPELATRDTDRIVPEEAERTPVESPYSLKRLSEKMDAALAAAETSARASTDALSAARDAANNSLTMMGRLDEFARELRALARRVTALEISRQWAPLFLASVAIALSIWLAFRVQELQHQLSDLQRLL